MSEYILPPIENYIVSGKQLREEAVHITKNKEEIKIIDMTDEHLWRAYMKVSNEELFREMVFRLFETRINPSKPNRFKNR